MIRFSLIAVFLVGLLIGAVAVVGFKTSRFVETQSELIACRGSRLVLVQAILDRLDEAEEVLSRVYLTEFNKSLSRPPKSKP